MDREGVSPIKLIMLIVNECTVHVSYISFMTVLFGFFLYVNHCKTTVNAYLLYATLRKNQLLIKATDK